MEQLKVEGISKSFDGEPVLADISITLNKGELVSLLGISGGGKTTLFNIIAGLSRPDTGHVLLDGEDVTGCPGRVSYMLQKDLLLPYRTIEDNVALPLIVKGMKKREAREAAFPYFRQDCSSLCQSAGRPRRSSGDSGNSRPSLSLQWESGWQEIFWAGW